MENYFAAYRFQVEIKEAAVAGFKSVKGLKISAAFEPLLVGGMNGGPVLLPVPVKDSGRLVFEKGKTLSALPDFVPGKKIADEIAIRVWGFEQDNSVRYLVENPVVEMLELSELDAAGSSILIQSFSVLHSGIKEG